MLQRGDPHVHLLPDQIKWSYETEFVFELEGKDTPAGYTWSLVRKGVAPLLKKETRWTPFSSGQGARCYGAFIGKQPVGFIEFTIDGQAKTTEIVTLVVAEAHRRQGVARKLVEVAETATRHAKAARVYAECESTNMPGLEAMRRIGFEFSGFSGSNGPGQPVRLFLSKAQK